MCFAPNGNDVTRPLILFTVARALVVPRYLFTGPTACRRGSSVDPCLRSTSIGRGSIGWWRCHRRI